ncbi:hypothetical protein RV14_GL001256 [Enterococcus ratti]|uniref:Uncharacterized protein n=1 Tax=Enterococcus ratti TaxID=150033 RepID=A0A1L8WAP4_9ENTE|nr:hypothetical protein RV14_GL001256 [Enterococcus ratti]
MRRLLITKKNDQVIKEIDEFERRIDMLALMLTLKRGNEKRKYLTFIKTSARFL